MNFIIALISSLFLSSVSQAIYLPDNSEQTVFKCDHSTLNVEVIRTFEDQYKIKMSPAAPIGFELFVEELVTHTEAQNSQIFVSEKVVLKLDAARNSQFRGTLIVINNTKQWEEYRMTCSVIFSIMKASHNQ